MPKLTVYVPVDLQHALDEIKSRGVDTSKLFCDAMLGFLSMCDDYQAPTNTIEDLAIRLKRVEEWVSVHIDEHSEQPDEEPTTPTSGTIHIARIMSGGYSMCGVTAKNSFVIGEVTKILEESPQTNLCMACAKLHRKRVAEEAAAEAKEKEDANKA